VTKPIKARMKHHHSKVDISINDNPNVSHATSKVIR